MTMYRIINNLTYKGDVIPGGSIQALVLDDEKIDKLIEVGAIAPVEPPPLAILPGWDARSKRLAPWHIITVSDLLEADVAELARDVRLKPATIREWQKSVVEYLTAKPAGG